MWYKIKTNYYRFRNSSGFRSTVILMVLGIASQLLGMTRDIILANKIGVGETLDIYYASFRVPDFIYATLISIVAGVTIIPMLSRAIHDKDWEEVSHKFSSLFNFFSIFTLGITALAYIFMPNIVHFIFSHTSIDWQMSVVSLSRLMLWQPILLNISNIFSTLAMVENKFLTYAVAPLFYNLGIILGATVLYDSMGTDGLVYGVVIGAAMHLLVQSISFWNSKVKFKFKAFDMKVIREELGLAIPRSLSLIMLQVRSMFVASTATAMGAGVFTSYTFANNFFLLPVTAIGISYVTVAFPRLSAMYESGYIIDLNKKIQKDISLLLICSVPVSILFYFYSKNIIHFVYPNIKDISQITIMLSTLSCTLPLYIMSLYYVRCSFARRDAISPLISQSLAAVTIIIVMYMLYARGYGVLSIVYAFNAGIALEAISIYFLFYTKKKNIE